MKRFGAWVFAILLGTIGAALVIGGAILIGAGGSFYYALAGLLVLASAVQLVRRRNRSAAIAYAALLAGTLAWSLWEAGLDGWALAPRLIGPAVLGLPFLFLRTGEGGVRLDRRLVGLALLAIAATLGIAAGLSVETGDAPPTLPMPGIAGATEWRNWGNTIGGSRFVPASQITTANADKLQLAWRFDSDAARQPIPSFEGTPLAADERLYVCLQPGIVAALDQDSGKQIWRYTMPGYDRVDFGKIWGGKCRGVSYYEAPGAVPECAKRILFGAPDGTLKAIDAATGQTCRSFGKDGSADLLEGMGLARDDLKTLPSSPPAIVNGVVVVGQTVTDMGSLDAPSGVVRGYDALTGALKWAWDVGRPGQTLLKPGETYTRASPNAWGPISGDEALGLVFVPTGNTLPDYFGGMRTPLQEKYSTSIVALDVATGAVRWSFQTVHHDIWDYDVAAQPVTVDLPGPNGTIPALIAPTKLGQMFVLDRRTGRPVDPVVERKVPQGGVPGERLSPTQPHTTGFPSLSGPDIGEKDTWGITPLDQMWCRIRLRKAIYQGQFTPTGFKDTLMFPGTAGGINWGSVTIDPERGLMMVNALRFANFGRLIPRQLAPKSGFGGGEGYVLFEMAGTPYVFAQAPFMSPLGVPCQMPPYGTIHVFDLKTRKPVWSKSFGTAAQSGPLGISSMLPIRMGVPNLGGSVATSGGVAFIAASQDRRLRAYDIGTGRELWSFPLPAVAAATPRTYVSAKTGRQYVVIQAGGHYAFPGPQAAAIMAFALPGSGSAQ